MLTDMQLNAMLVLQDSMNNKVNSEWKKANNDWMLATALEGAEAIDHHGWKWWKKQTPNMAQFQMELVDIWHFGLSHTIIKSFVSGEDELEILNDFSTTISFDGEFYPIRHSTLLENTKLLIGLAMAKRFEPSLFYIICEQANLSMEDLYKQYLGKNVLNFFRQDNGYKKGTYIKIWFDGREDNEHLVEILNRIDLSHADADKAIYRNLRERYAKNYA